MSRVICVSNRVSLPDPETGKIKAGGLAVGVKAALESVGGGVWFGWSGAIEEDAKNKPLETTTSGNIDFITMPLSKADYSAYYKGMSNEGLWPLMHELDGHIDEDGRSHERYRAVNKRFARHIREFAEPDDVIWVHDYHLLPLGKELRNLGVKNKIMFFNHIPVPSPDFFESEAVSQRLRKQYKHLLQDLFAYDQVGFQSFRDFTNFTATLGLADPAPGRFETKALSYGGKKTAFGVFPISIETAELEDKAAHSDDIPEVAMLRRQFEGQKLVIGAERLDYTKGLLKRIDAVSEFLRNYSEYHEKIKFLQITPLSRADMDQYQRTIDKLREKVSTVQADHTTDLWSPIRYSEKGVPRERLIGYFRLAAAGLVTSLMDGQNLVAKEFIAAQNPEDPGVLVLSRNAGAAEELEETGALLVDPRDPADIAARLKEALEMPLEERKAHHEKALAWLRENDIDHWARAFLTPQQPPQAPLQPPQL